MKAFIQLYDELFEYDPGEMFVNASHLFEIYRHVQPVFRQSYLFLIWKNYSGSCEPYFQEIITDTGICYTFNTLDFKDIYRSET